MALRCRAGAGTQASGSQSNNFTTAWYLLSQMSHTSKFQADSQHAFLPGLVFFNRGFPNHTKRPPRGAETLENFTVPFQN